MTTASLYVRLSKEAKATNLSLAGMMDESRALAARLGFSVLAEHVDDGVSGAVRDRPAFRAWLDDAISGRADVLVTFSADRLTREGVNAAALILDVIEGKDPHSGAVVRTPVRLVSVDGLDSKDADSFRWRFVIAAEVARAERERIKARNLATRARLLKAGRFTGGGAPFGTRTIPHPDGTGKILVRDDAEAEILVEAANRLIRGDALRAVVRWLNAELGSRTRRGIEWQRASLRATLLSGATREHVLDLSTFRAVEKALERSAAPARPGRPQSWLLSGGLAVCASCGRKMTTSAGRYICSSTSQGLPCPLIVSIDARQTDDWIADRFLRTFGRFEHFEPRLVLSGAEDLDSAERALEAAQSVLLTAPTPEALATYQEAQVRFEEARSLPQSRETILVSTDRTIRDVWETSDAPFRAALLTDALDDVVTILPNPGGKSRGRQKVQFEARVLVPWRGETPEEPEGDF